LSRDPGQTLPSPVRKVVFTSEAIAERVQELGREISRSYSETDRLVVLGVLKGSVMFVADLVRAMDLPLELDFLVVSSYGGSMVSSGNVTVRYGPELDLRGRAVLVVEDIVDSGATLSELVPRLEELGASRVDVVALLHKRLVSGGVEPRWIGFDAPKSFLVGYGLDHAGAFRHLPYIASL